MRPTKVLFANFGEKEALASMKLVKELRNCGISAELYPDNVKMKKQIGYADALNAKYFAIIGETELADGMVTLKHLSDGRQETIPASGIAEYLK